MAAPRVARHLGPPHEQHLHGRVLPDQDGGDGSMSANPPGERCGRTTNGVSDFVDRDLHAPPGSVARRLRTRYPTGHGRRRAARVPLGKCVNDDLRASLSAEGTGQPGPEDGRPVESETEEEEEESRSFGQWLREVVRTWGPAILAVVLIRTFIFEPFRIPSPSMVPTLLIGDHVLVTKFSYGIWLTVPFTNNWPGIELLDTGDPDRGDVIVFLRPDTGDNYIKRVVGLPGDEISVQNNRLFINGKPQPVTRIGTYDYQGEANTRTNTCPDMQGRLHVESLERSDGSILEHPILTDYEKSLGHLADMATVRVPEGSVFVMGDNRDHSGDSREGMLQRRGLGFIDEYLIKGKAHFIWLSWNGCAADWNETIRGGRFFQSLYNSQPAEFTPLSGP